MHAHSIWNKISIATGNSTCNNNTSQSSVVVYNSLVNLTCCVEEFACVEWTINWYRNGSDEEISHGRFLFMNLTEPQETFICVAEANNPISDPVCYEYHTGAVTLIQGRYIYTRIIYIVVHIITLKNMRNYSCIHSFNLLTVQVISIIIQ